MIDSQLWVKQLGAYDEARAIITTWDSASLTNEQQEAIAEFQTVVENPYQWEYVD